MRSTTFRKHCKKWFYSSLSLRFAFRDHNFEPKKQANRNQIEFKERKQKKCYFLLFGKRSRTCAIYRNLWCITMENCTTMTRVCKRQKSIPPFTRFLLTGKRAQTLVRWQKKRMHSSRTKWHAFIEICVCFFHVWRRENVSYEFSNWNVIQRRLISWQRERKKKRNK